MATKTEGARVEDLEHTLEEGVVGARRIELPDRPIELHEMPTLAAEAVGAPEAEYITPRRPWLRFLGIGLAAGAVGLAAGIGLGLTVLAPTEPLADYATSLRLEHLAQAPLTSGFGAATSLAQEHLAQAPVTFAATTSLAQEHLAQTPGGFPLTFAASTSLAQEHLAQTPGGFPVSTQDLYGGQPYLRPDAPVSTVYDLYGGQPYVRA